MTDCLLGVTCESYDGVVDAAAAAKSPARVPWRALEASLREGGAAKTFAWGPQTPEP